MKHLFSHNTAVVCYGELQANNKIERLESKAGFFWRKK